MKAYAVSLALGLLVGVIYGLFHVRSPAPPIIALVGLLGILLGEQIPPLVRQFWVKEGGAISFLEKQVRPHVFGHLPKGRAAVAPDDAATADRTGREET
jgi:XapX domain-containing protein